MKIKILLLASIGIFLAGCGTYMSQRPKAKWQDPANWEKLEVGMNESQVRARLGKPPLDGDHKISEYENWYYPDPEGGVVRMDPEGRVIGFRTPWQAHTHRLANY